MLIVNFNVNAMQILFKLPIFNSNCNWGLFSIIFHFQCIWVPFAKQNCRFIMTFGAWPHLKHNFHKFRHFRLDASLNKSIDTYFIPMVWILHYPGLTHRFPFLRPYSDFRIAITTMCSPIECIPNKPPNEAMTFL